MMDHRRSSAVVKRTLNCVIVLVYIFFGEKVFLFTSREIIRIF